MQDLITIPMVDIISELTGRTVVMKDTDYVFFDTKEVVEEEVLNEATLLKAEMEEEQRVQQIEDKCNQAIESVYPIYKQINITNLLTPYIEDDRDVMKAFIDSKRAICHKAIADGTKAEDVDYSNES